MPVNCKCLLCIQPRGPPPLPTFPQCLLGLFEIK